MNTKFITEYLKEGHFVYNGVENDNGGCGYIINNGFDNIVKQKRNMCIFDILTDESDIENLKQIMSNSENKVIKISDIDLIVKISVSSIKRFEEHIDNYTNEVLIFKKSNSKADIMYYWNIG